MVIMKERADSNTQLTLIETVPEWRLEPKTREIGLVGVRQAREALQAALAGKRDASHRTAA
jgi:hypothetical protein